MSKLKTRVFMTAVVLATTFTMFGTADAQVKYCPNGPCEPKDPVPLPPPPQYVSRPDAAVQFSPCLPDGLAWWFRNMLQEKLASIMDELDINHNDPTPTPDVRQICASGKHTFGSWLHPVGSYGGTDTDTARNLGLSQVNVLAPGEEFAFHFRSAGINRLVNIRWQDQPRTLNDGGYADPDGDIHLTDYQIDYTNSDYYGRTVVDLNLKGSYEGVFSTTDITAHLTDFLTVNAFGGINCETYPWAEATETTLDTILASLVGAGASLDDITEAGPGCRIAQMLPRSWLVPFSAVKVVFTYTRVYASNGVGLTLAGTWEVLARNPGVWITGPVSLLVEQGEPIVGHYDAYPSDLRYPLTFSWTSANAVASGTDPATLTWNIPSLGVGQTAHRTVTLIVTDADGYQAWAWRPLTISKVEVKPPSPMCEEKPWLSQCQDY